MKLLSAFFKSFRKEAPPPIINAIDAVELNRRLAKLDLVVVDVRNPDEFSGPLGHIKDAINAPLPSLDLHLQELAQYRTRQVVVVCLSDKRSTQAIHLLRDAGFKDLTLLRGGMKDWAAHQLPVVS